MCRYSGKRYKHHFVCFACRKQFKRPPLRDVLAETGRLETYERLLSMQARRGFDRRAALTRIESEYRTTVSTCPQCGQTMADLGRDFKPPRSTALKAWKRLQGMHTLGIQWHTCGCSGPGYIPTNQADFRAYLRELLAKFSKRRSLVPASAQEGEYWSDRIARVNAVLTSFDA